MSHTLLSVYLVNREDAKLHHRKDQEVLITCPICNLESSIKLERFTRNGCCIACIKVRRVGSNCSLS